MTNFSFSIVKLSFLFVFISVIAGCPAVPDPLIQIPVVTGLAREVAETTLTEAGFNNLLIKEVSSTSVPKGKIVNQLPAAKSWVSNATPITLYVSTGDTEHPTESWTRVYGEGKSMEAADVYLTNDGSYIVTGETSDAPQDVAVYLQKLNDQGEELWRNTYGVTDTQRGEVVRQTEDGGFIIAGYTHIDQEYGQMLLIKTRHDGREEWISTLGIEGLLFRAHGLALTSDGGYVLTGITQSDPGRDIGFGGHDIFIMKTNSIGQEEWTVWYGDEEDDAAYAIEPTVDGGFIIAGYTASFGALNKDVFLLKTDENGLVEWAKSYGGSLDDIAHDVKLTPDGGYLLTGYTNSFDVPFRDIYVIKTNNGGVHEWSRIIDLGLLIGDDAGSDEYAKAVQITPDGEFVLAGTTNALGDDGSITLIKLGTSGSLVWYRIIGGAELDQAFSLQMAYDNGYVIAGSTQSSGVPIRQAYIFKTDENGLAIDDQTP